MEKKRCTWIDIAKGIGIILVIYGHISFRPLWLNLWLCSFHMPLFFFLAGLTFNTEKYSRLSVLVKNKFKQIMIPYFMFAIVLWIWYIVQQTPKIIGGAYQLSADNKKVYWHCGTD